jgi:hypothetical protein
MLFRLQNAANSLTSPTMTVPFDTDVLLFLVSATSPSGHTQPMEVHAYVSVEQWPLWNPVRWATVPPRSSSQGKEGPLRGLACRQGRLRSDRAAVQQPGKKIRKKIHFTSPNYLETQKSGKSPSSAFKTAHFTSLT